MWTKKIIQLFVIISVIIAFAAPLAFAGGAGGNGDPIAWYFFEAGLLDKDTKVKGSRVTGRVTSIKLAEGLDDSCIEAYSAYLYLIVELNIGKSTELYFFNKINSSGETGFCAVDYTPQIHKLDDLLQDEIGPFYWDSIKSVGWNDNPIEGDIWEIFNFSITIPYP